MSRLQTRHIRSEEELTQFFNETATHYKDRHGCPERLLNYRLSIIQSLMGGEGRTLLEIGCGTGNHLFELEGQFESVIGTDISPVMIEKALERLRYYKNTEKFQLSVDRAETLSTVSDQSIDVVLCVGAFEHMIDKASVLFQIDRVLKGGGRFVCLTPNGDYIWYRKFAPALGYDTRHLSSDRFMSLSMIRKIISDSTLSLADSGYWTFIPKGDIGIAFSLILSVIDYVGRLFEIPEYRGGICFQAVKTTKTILP